MVNVKIGTLDLGNGNAKGWSDSLHEGFVLPNYFSTTADFIAHDSSSTAELVNTYDFDVYKFEGDENRYAWGPDVYKTMHPIASFKTFNRYDSPEF